MSDDFAEELDRRQRDGLYRRRRRPQSVQGPRLRLGGRELVNFASNDYLHYAADPRLARAAAVAARRGGCGAGASARGSGWLPPLRALERDLARWEGTAAALVLSSGFAANLACVTALASRGDAIFSDALNHASLIDGCRLSRADLHVYTHADVNHLADLLRREDGKYRRRWIVTDTVFSMDGDLAPLADLADVAAHHGAALVLDEAHATGVLGEGGRGLTELQSPGWPGTVRLVKVGTLSKALGSQGGFVVADAVVIDWLVNAARPYIFSTALAPPAAAAARQAVRLIAEEPERRRHVLALGDLLRQRLREAGFPETGSRTPIVPIVVGDPTDAMHWSRRLRERGLLVPAIRPPSVPAGTARLRVSLTAGHTTEEVERLAEALRLLR